MRHTFDFSWFDRFWHFSVFFLWLYKDISVDAFGASTSRSQVEKPRAFSAWQEAEGVEAEEEAEEEKQEDAWLGLVFFFFYVVVWCVS